MAFMMPSSRPPYPLNRDPIFMWTPNWNPPNLLAQAGGSIRGIVLAIVSQHSPQICKLIPTRRNQC
jgi:hypothetical protein